MCRALSLSVSGDCAWRLRAESRRADPIAANRLGRNFVASRPGQVWLADLTDIPTGEGWLYLAVLDRHTGKIVGWSRRAHWPTEIALAALNLAIERQRGLRLFCLAKSNHDCVSLNLKLIHFSLRTTCQLPELTVSDTRTKQRLIHILVQEIVCELDDTTKEAVLLIHWTGGRHSEAQLPRAARQDQWIPGRSSARGRRCPAPSRRPLAGSRNRRVAQPHALQDDAEIDRSTPADVLS